MTILETEDLHASYGSAPALFGISLVAESGRITGVVGPNGAGKTTLLLAVAGLTVKTRGSVRLNGVEIGALPAYERARRGLWLVPDNRGIFPPFSVRENLKLAKSKVSSSALDDLFQIFPALRDRLKQRAGTLSGGEQQMLGLARAFLSGREVILVDEPSLGLAPVVMDRVTDALRSIASDGRVVVVSEQNAQIALDMADHAYVLSHGRQMAEGAGSALRSDVNMLATYFGIEGDIAALENIKGEGIDKSF